MGTVRQVGLLIDIAAPARLGTRFRWLLASAWLAQLGDGMALAAGPLLVASLTHDPFYIALAATLQWLPRLAFGLVAGAVTDRMDRRRVAVAMNLFQAAALAALGSAVFAGHVSISWALAILFLLGVSEVFADNSVGALMPMLVPREELGSANARLQTAFITLNQLAGPPIGAAAFVIGRGLPFVVEAALTGAAAVLIVPVGAARSLTGHQRSHILREIADGLRWAACHAAVRTLTLTIFVFNLTYGAAASVLVLYAYQRLGLGSVGFGLLTTVGAAGGLLGTASYRLITRHLSLGAIMRIGLAIETLSHLALAVVTSASLAMVIMFVFGAHAFVWGTTSSTVRQRAVPHELQGRVNGVNTVGVFGGLVIGSLIGGALARRYGVTAPFWYAFAGSAVFLVGLWRQLTRVDSAD
jgi:MFS family permease